MTDSLMVDPTELLTHSSHIGVVRDMTAQAADAAKQVTPGGLDNAYGVMCQFLGQAVDSVGREVQDLLRKMTDTLSQTQQSVQRAGQDYQRQEDEANNTLQDLRNDLDGVGIPSLAAPGGQMPR